MPARRALALAFPVLLFLTCAFFLRGDTGFWADDYFHNRRSADGTIPPITFSWRWPLWPLAIDRGFFIRPLYYQVIPAITTLSWNHPWVAHAVQALCHAGVALLLWRFMLALGISRGASHIASLAFLVYPGAYEVQLWVAAMATALSAAGMLGVLFLVIGLARARRGWWRLPVMGAGVFAVCCLNEQPASAVAAMPLVYLMAARKGAPRPVLRALLPAIVCGLAGVAYAKLLTSTALPGHRGSADAFVAAGDLPARLSAFTSSLWRGLVMREFASGAWSMGLRTIAGSGLAGWGVMAALVLASFAWIARARGVIEPDRPRRKRWHGVMLGLIVFIAGWAPIVVMAEYEPDSRMRYWPCLGLAVALACCIESRRGSMHRAVYAGRAALAAALLGSAVMMVGIQAAYRVRWERDQSEAAQLRALVPDPAPFTLFQPVDIHGTGLDTGAAHFDEHFHGVWWYPWTPRRFVQQAYGRDTIAAAYFQRPGEPVLGGDERGLLFRVALGPRYGPREGEGSRVPWGQLVPFVVEADGRVRVVTACVIEGKRVEVPQAKGLEAHEIELPRR